MPRTKGAKDKQPRQRTVKKVMITKAEADLATKVGVPVETYAKEKLKLQKARKPRKPRKPKIDWEKLAKQLQQALAKEIKENQELSKFNLEAVKRNIKLQGVIEHLEGRLGNN